MGKGWGKDMGKGWGKDMGKGWGKDMVKGKKGGGLRDFAMEKKVWLGDVPEEVDRNELKEHMNQAGACKFVSVSKGQGGAAYATEEEAQNAIAMLNGSMFGGAVIQVDVCTHQEGSMKSHL